MKKWCYVDGKITASSKPQIKLGDLGLLRGYAVFDFIKVVRGQPLFWPEHLKRFRSSARALGLKLNVTDQKLTHLAQELLKKNDLKNQDASLRLILTGGESTNGMLPNGKNILALIVEESYNLPAKIFKTGGKLITVDYCRSFPQAKSTNYLLAVSLQGKKNKAGAVEILYLDRGRVLEASTSNFFLIKDKKIITPLAGVLGGITRSKIIGLAKRTGYRVEEREVAVSELKTADEAFITATNKDVCPIVKIDQLKIGNGKVGEITQKLLANYRTLIQ